MEIYKLPKLLCFGHVKIDSGCVVAFACQLIVCSFPLRAGNRNRLQFACKGAAAKLLQQHFPWRFSDHKNIKARNAFGSDNLSPKGVKRIRWTVHKKPTWTRSFST